MLFATATSLIVLLFLVKRYRWFYILYRTLGRDLRACVKFFKLNYRLWRCERHDQTIPKVFQKLAQKHPRKVAFYFEDESWTFERVEKYSNQVAHYFLKEGLKRGEAVALILESRPEYVCIWLGLAKIGVVTALINNNLVNDPLLHSIKVSDVKSVIFGADFARNVKEIAPKIPHLNLYQLTGDNQTPLENAKDLKEITKHFNISPKAEIRKGRSRDKLIFIFTSGTTGLPKAAVITNLRYMFMAYGLHYMTGLNEDDVLYDPLPLYHSAGGVVGVGQCLLAGVTVTIRRKFSASGFWSDCVKYKCTAAQYIGEICRYILAAHRNDGKTVQHNVRLMMGNGLRPQIWTKFVEQFGVKQIFELYGATEGNSNLINIDSTVGAVGFVPRYAGHIYPVTLIKCNELTGEPIRDVRGFCTRCQPNESGVLIGHVNRNKTVNDFAGYADQKATEKKLISNVFKKGDLYFNSGDILVQDEFGYYYFKDRTGDTFRWKGENVATSEIEAVISNVASLNDAVVYGVEIPGNEGRAGMAAIVDTTRNLDLAKFFGALKSNVPSYAIPIFLRVMDAVPMTGTFKLKKNDLQQEGYDLDKIKDQIFILDQKNATYIELTRDKYEKILSGQDRF